jgi:chromosome segregation ATPase
MERTESSGSSGQRTDNLSPEIVFDTSSGISMDEQQEILAEINAMAGGRNLVKEAAGNGILSGVLSGAKKKGYVFPLAVNISAIILLAAGFFLLYFLHGQDEQQIRESTAVLGLTERILIQEIRQETNRLISEKENEINNILSMLSAVDAEYRVLAESVETLTEVQRERAAYLLMMQEGYHQTLSQLQEERAGILEDARLREANLRAQAEERTRELTLRMEQDQVSLSEAMEELRQLGSEQERANRAESQMSGFYTAVNNQISESRLAEASHTLTVMREFLDAPSLQGLRIFESRKQTHLTVINLMESAIAVSLSGAATGTQNELAELMAQNVVLERRNANLERDIAAFSSQDSDQARIISEYMAAVRELEDTQENQQQMFRAEMAQRETQWDNERNTFRTEMTQWEQQVNELNRNLTVINAENEEIQRQNDDLQRQIEAIRVLLQN